MSRLITAVMLRRMNEQVKDEEIIGNIFLLKFFNNIEDAREISAMINACSRMGSPDTSLGLCLGNHESKRKLNAPILNINKAYLPPSNISQKQTKSLAKTTP